MIAIRCIMIVECKSDGRSWPCRPGLHGDLALDCVSHTVAWSSPQEKLISHMMHVSTSMRVLSSICSCRIKIEKVCACMRMHMVISGMDGYSTVI